MLPSGYQIKIECIHQKGFELFFLHSVKLIYSQPFCRKHRDGLFHRFWGNSWYPAPSLSPAVWDSESTVGAGKPKSLISSATTVKWTSLRQVHTIYIRNERINRTISCRIVEMRSPVMPLRRHRRPVQLKGEHFSGNWNPVLSIAVNLKRSRFFCSNWFKPGLLIEQ